MQQVLGRGGHEYTSGRVASSSRYPESPNFRISRTRAQGATRQGRAGQRGEVSCTRWEARDRARVPNSPDLPPSRLTSNLPGRDLRHDVASQRRDGRTTQEGEGPLDFGAKQREHALHPFLSTDCQPPQVRPGDQDCPCAETKRFDDVGPAPNPSVDENGGAAGDRIHSTDSQVRLGSNSRAMKALSPDPVTPSGNRACRSPTKFAISIPAGSRNWFRRSRSRFP